MPVNTHNSLWSGIFFITLLIPLCIGCVINSIIFKNQKSKIRFLFYYFSFMLSFGILLISILTIVILKDLQQSLIFLAIYILLSLVSLIGYFIQKKYNYQNEKIFLYFTILFFVSLMINIMSIIIHF